MVQQGDWCPDEIWQIYFDCVCTRCREDEGRRAVLDHNLPPNIPHLPPEVEASAAAAAAAAVVVPLGMSAGSWSCQMLVMCVGWT